MRRVQFHPAALDEARAAATWYRERSNDAARAFTSAIAEGVESIREHPEAWPAWRNRPDVRRRVLGRLPYSLFYTFTAEDGLLVVVAVAHHRRRPGYWIPRIR